MLNDTYLNELFEITELFGSKSPLDGDPVAPVLQIDNVYRSSDEFADACAGGAACIVNMSLRLNIVGRTGALDGR